MLGIKYKSHKHSLQSTQGEEETSPEGHSKMSGVNHFLVCFLLSFCWQCREPRQPACFSIEHRETKISAPLHPTLYFHTVLNFNSHRLAFVKVIYSSLFLLTTDHHWIDDASYLWVNKVLWKVQSTPQKMHVSQGMSSFFQYVWGCCLAS